MLKKLLEFIGGKNPNIFNKKGKVQHNLGDKRWQAWEEKNKSNPEYNWKQHKGRASSK